MARPNSSTGVKGVTINSSGRYVAQKKINGVNRYLGSFGTLEEAVAAYDSDGQTATGTVAEFDGHEKVVIVERGGRYSVRRSQLKGKKATIAIMDTIEDAQAIARQAASRYDGSARRAFDFNEVPSIGTPAMWKKRMWRVVGSFKKASNGVHHDMIVWADGMGKVGICGLKASGLTMISEMM